MSSDDTLNSNHPSNPKHPNHANWLAMEYPENQLGLVVTPNSVHEERQLPLKTRLIAIISMPLFFLLTFTICYVSASHAPQPHDMALTLAGPPSVTEQIADKVTDQAPGGFDITQVTSAADARDAVNSRDAVGAIIIAGSNVTTVVASGEGALTVPLITTVGAQVAAELGGTATVENAAPLPDSDPGGSVLFFFLVICTVGAFLSITAIGQAFAGARTRSLVATAAGAGLVVPVLGFSMVSLFVSYDVTFGAVAGVIGVGMIYTFTIGLLATLFVRAVGQAAIFAQILFLIGLNFPAAGGSAPESMLPPFWQVVQNIWVGPGGFEAMRSILYFEGNGVGRWLLQLLIWTAAVAVLLLVVSISQKRKAAADLAAEASGSDEGSAEGVTTATVAAVERPSSPVSARGA